MGQHPESALAFACGIGPTTEGTPESPLVPGEGGLDLPPLTEHPTVPTPLGLLAEALDHLPSVLGLGPLAAVPPAVQGDHGGPNPEVFAARSVVLFTVERGVGQHPIPGHGQGCLDHDRTQLWRVVGRAGGNGGPGEEVTLRVASDGELGPQPRGVFASGPLEEVA